MCLSWQCYSSIIGSKVLTRQETDRVTKLAEQVGRVSFLNKSLSDENRLRILLTLANGRKSVSSIVEELNLSQPLVSHHLRELRRSLIVKVERKGPFVYYEMADERIIEILEALAGLADDLLAKRTTF
jgi:DNA-binding transcriptional ArsR family regulator